MTGTPRLLVLFTLAVVIVVLAIASLATGSWWLLLIALPALAIGMALALKATGRALGQGDKPDPTTAARLDEGKERGRGPDGGDDGDDEPRMAI